jgi:hypothetical protein
LQEFQAEVEYMHKTGKEPRIKGFGIKDCPITKLREEEVKNRVIKKKDYMKDIEI